MRETSAARLGISDAAGSRVIVSRHAPLYFRWPDAKPKKFVSASATPPRADSGQFRLSLVTGGSSEAP